MTMKVTRIRNWRKYNEALVARGSLTVWFDKDVIKNWHENNPIGTRGRPKRYSDRAIICGLTLKAVFNLTFRAVEGFIKSLAASLLIDPLNRLSETVRLTGSPAMRLVK